MPLITVTFAAHHGDLVSKPEIAEEISWLSSTVLGKDPKVTAVILQRVEPEDWFAAGRSLAEQDLSSFWLDIHITEGTNTKDEKAKFIAETFKTMRQLLGPLHEESYVHVHEARADAYGYGGLTSEQRYIAGKVAAPASVAAAA
jgi:4-oxalocrotonate tautomerase